MASPSFILLAKSSTIDKDTGGLSIFHIVEKIQLTAIPPEQPGTKTILVWEPVKLIAEWILDSGDKPDDEFDIEFTASITGTTGTTGTPKPLEFLKGPFRFESGLRHRTILTFATPFIIDRTAQMMSFISRLKKKNAPDSEWRQQTYSISIEYLENAPNPNIISVPTPASPS